ncbi:MAG: type II toxin-antitoxin system RelE/ParE family toxin [Nitrospiraceae bacterium]|nr:type II toxin-antitoxin system RelE/ParE family toxin [Nitrospiraceae bacterium]MSR24994.1 type II toxin-antitoxin system RelE/ParE family toxin [Nitrospiraceae bacterium]
MASKRPVFTENFSRNLLDVQAFLGPEGVRHARRLLDRLLDEVVPTICRFPQSGRSFLAHAIHSKEGKTLFNRVRDQLEEADDLREFVMDDYILLYLVRSSQIVFLSIKHHRQLSFDLRQFWQEG